MTRISLKLEGMAQLQAALSALGEKAEAELSKAIDATGLELRGDIVKRYQRGPKTGSTYRKYNPNRTHTASAPGEAPATDTGRLASGVDYTKDGKLSATVGSRVVYAAMQELGTARIAPRPAWVPATEAMRPKFRKRAEAALARAAQ